MRRNMSLEVRLLKAYVLCDVCSVTKLTRDCILDSDIKRIRPYPGGNAKLFLVLSRMLIHKLLSSSFSDTLPHGENTLLGFRCSGWIDL